MDKSKSLALALAFAAGTGAGAVTGRATAPTETVETERVEYAPARPVDDVATSFCIVGLERAGLDSAEARNRCLKAKPSLTNAAEYAARKVAKLGQNPDPDQLRAVVNDEVEALAQAGTQGAKRDWEDRYTEALEKCKPLPGSTEPRCVAPRPRPEDFK